MNIGVIGVGNIASAILEGILRNNVFPSDSIYLFDPYSKNVTSFVERGCNVCQKIDDLVRHSNLVLVAVKPSQIEKVLNDVTVVTKGKCFISVAAGISIEFIKSILEVGTYIIRVMPNTPIMVGCGATAIALDKGIPMEYVDKAVSIFSSSGAVTFVDEHLINAATAVNGSGPAYFFSMADEMIKTVVQLGVDPESALLLTAKTMEGASRMLLESGKSPSELVRDVSSPGGTTVAALAEMKENGFYTALKAGMKACIRRAEEIGK